MWMDGWVDGQTDKEMFYSCNCHLVPPKEVGSLTTHLDHSDCLAFIVSRQFNT